MLLLITDMKMLSRVDKWALLKLNLSNKMFTRTNNQGNLVLAKINMRWEPAIGSDLNPCFKAYPTTNPYARRDLLFYKV